MKFVSIFAATLLFQSFALGQSDVVSPAPQEARKLSQRDEFNRALPLPVRIPPEFGKLSAVVLSANELVHLHPKLFASLVDQISKRAPVIAIVSGPEELLDGREALEDAGIDRDRVNFLIHPLDSMWIRDFGPIFIRRSDGTGSVIDLYYSARDERGPRPFDDQWPLVMAYGLGLQCSYVPIAMEGGNLVHNGNGLGVSTIKLIERNKFRNFGGDEFSGLMNSYLSLKTLVLVPPLPGEPTGHSDMFMTFVNPRTLIIAEAGPDEAPEVAASLERSVEIMREQVVGGRPIDVQRIPLPPRKDGMWRSYTNVFYVNGLLLVPSYSDVDPEIEARVFETYRRLLPEWDVVAVKADDLIEVGGFLHCITLGIPHFIDVKRLLEFTE